MVMNMEEVIRYLRKYIDESAVCETWTGEAKRSLSLYLIGAFEFYAVSLLGEQVLFLMPTVKYTPVQLEKMLRQIEEKTEMNGVLVLDEASPYIIRKFLKDRVGFIVPDKQISMPFLAMHIKSENTRKQREILHFSPVTQLTFLYVLYSEQEEFELNEIGEKLNVSDMTAIRSMRDLVDLGLLKCKTGGRTGRKKIFYRIPVKDYFEDGRKYLSSPVRDVMYVCQLPDGLILPKADLTALSEQTMLADNGPDRFCFPYRQRDVLKEYEISKDQAKAENLPMIQLLKYDTGCLSRNGFEDPISLILGLSEKDERIEIAIDELMEGYEWYEA